MRVFSVVVLSLLLTGCVSSGSSDQAANARAAKATGVTCDRERTTGTRLSRTRCRTQAEIDRDREDARQTARRARPPSIPRPQTR